MRHSKSLTAPITAAVVAVALGAAARPAHADATLDRVATHLYYHQSGAVDDREASALQLWNTTIGEGDAKAASGAVIVHVTVSGGETIDKGVIEVVARAGKKRLFKQRVSLDDYLIEKGKPVIVPFVLYGTGCQSLEVAATLQAGRKKLGEKAVVLPFACAE